MIMSQAETEKAESLSTIQPPLLSVVVPVYNGGKKIESTLQKLKSQIEELRSALTKLESQGKQDKGPVNTGRNIIKNAGAAILLDEYLSRDVPSGFELSDRPKPALPSYEIIVVNDGSKDDTRSIVDQISSADETIRLISYSVNMGKGYAIKQGVLHSRGKYVMFLDGDGEISTKVLSKYLDRLGSTDLVIASKYHTLSVVSVPASRKFFSKCFHLFVKLLLGIKVSDTQVGLKAGRGDTFRKIFQRVIVKRYAFDAEMLAVAGILGLRVDELPVNIELIKSFKKKEIVRMALDVLGIAYRLRIIKWYHRNMKKERPHYEGIKFAWQS